MAGTIREKNGKKTYLIDGREVTEAEFLAEYPDKPIGWYGGQLPKCWPMTSEVALAVQPDQVQEAIADSIREGVPTHFREDGAPVFTDKAHYKRYCEKYGLHAKNGGYSDPQRK